MKEFIWKREEGTGERQRGRPVLCLTMGPLCSLKGAGIMVLCKGLQTERPGAPEFFPGKWGLLLGQDEMQRRAGEGHTQGLSDKTGVCLGIFPVLFVFVDAG